jgi:hypothetical protein
LTFYSTKKKRIFFSLKVGLYQKGELRMSSGNVIFDANAEMGNMCGLRGYLFVDALSLDDADLDRYPYDTEAYSGEDASSWTFESVLARLNSIANQVIFDDGNFDKSCFEINGTYKGQFFRLYDYREDRCVHIGGGPELDVDGLIAELNELIKAAVPKPFTCRSSYRNARYSYP